MKTQMKISTLIGITEKFFLNGRHMTDEEQALLGLVAGVKIHDKTKEEFMAIDADTLKAMIAARNKAAKQFYLDKAKEYDTK
jgi:hypothetical protein